MGLLGTLSAVGGGTGSGRPRWAQRLAYAHLGYVVGRQAVQVARARRNRDAYTVSVHDTDVIYGEVQRWVLDRMAPAAQRALIVHTTRRDQIERRPTGGDVPEITLHFDGQRTQTVTVDGHTVEVTIVREDAPTTEEMSYSDTRASRSWRPAKITFTARTVAARDAVVALLDQIAGDLRRRARPPYLRTATFWGDWMGHGPLETRPLDTVVLADGVLERITGDLERFLAARARYKRLGVPHHRGYLLSGPPGTGKTSVGRALAGHFGLDVWYLPLSDLKEDAVLGKMLASIETPAMLLIEDVDVARAATSRDDQGRGVTLSGLLNGLDGVVTPDGLVTVLTTNHADRLDPALVRDGRVDLHERLGAMDTDQLARLLKAFELPWPDGDLGRALEAGRLPTGLTPAHVVGVAKRHLDGATQDEVAEDLARLLSGTLVSA